MIQKTLPGVPHHKLAFWVAACLGLTGLLITLGARVGALGRRGIAAFPLSSTGAGTTTSEEFGLVLLIMAFAMFGIAWHLAGKQVGPNKN